MNDEQIKYLLSLPPEEIVKWFQDKGLSFSWNWDDIIKDAHARAFTAAKVMKLDILQELKNEVDKIFTHGITYNTFRKELEPILKRLGWWGKVKAADVPGYNPESGVDPEKIVQLGSPKRLETIFQTNSNVAYNAGRYKFQMQNAASRPYWMYMQLERKHKRKAHAFYANKVFMWDDPIWDKIYPPNGFNCGCYVIALSKEEFESRGLKLSQGSDVRVDVAEGWDYNPGKSYYNPPADGYDKNLYAKFIEATDGTL